MSYPLIIPRLARVGQRVMRGFVCKRVAARALSDLRSLTAAAGAANNLSMNSDMKLANSASAVISRVSMRVFLLRFIDVRIARLIFGCKIETNFACVDAERTFSAPRALNAATCAASRREKKLGSIISRIDATPCEARSEPSLSKSGKAAAHVATDTCAPGPHWPTQCEITSISEYLPDVKMKTLWPGSIVPMAAEA